MKRDSKFTRRMYDRLRKDPNYAAETDEAKRLLRAYVVCLMERVKSERPEIRAQCEDVPLRQWYIGNTVFKHLLEIPEYNPHCDPSANLKLTAFAFDETGRLLTCQNILYADRSQLTASVVQEIDAAYVWMKDRGLL